MNLRRFPFAALAVASAVSLSVARATAAPSELEPPRLRLPAVAEPTGYAVELTIDPTKDSFRGEIDIDVRAKEKLSVLWLNASALKIETVSASVNALSKAGALPMGEALALVPRFAGDLVSKPGEDDDTRLLRQSLVPFVVREGDEPRLQAEAKRLALRWLDDRKAIDPDLAGPILEIAARYGDRELLERFRAAAKTATDRRDRRRLLSALGAFRDPAVVGEALSLYLSGDFDPREADAILFSASQEEASRQRVWDFVKANFDAIVAKMPREMIGIMPAFASSFCDAAHRKDVERFFQGRIDKLPGGPRYLAQTLEEIDLCAASRAAQAPSVREFLERY